jgi:hypothetical protein
VDGAVCAGPLCPADEPVVDLLARVDRASKEFACPIAALVRAGLLVAARFAE